MSTPTPDAPPAGAAASTPTPPAPSTTAAAPAAAPAPGPPKPKSGLRSALEYTGVPPSLFDKRPRLPSRNWLIFLSVTASVAGFYAYDRRECRRIRAEYAARVAHLADVPLHPLDLPRKVTVYAAKWPGDDDWDRNALYFRKYVKPILNAAAVEHEIIRGKRVGDVAERISDAIRAERRIGAGLDPPRASPVPLATNRTPQERAARALAGGTVVVGRSTLKEYLAGLKSGWTDSLAKVDRDATLADALADDGTFDEPDEPALVGPDGEPLPTPVRPPAPGTTGPIFSPLQAQIRALESAAPAPPTAAAPQAIPAALDAPPAVLPALPPLLLVPHTNRIGLRHIPMMIWEWFNERERVLAGAQAGVALVRGATRPFSAPPPDVLAARDAAAAAAKAAASASEGDMADMADAPAPPAPGPDDATDLDFDRTGERVYKPSLSSWHADLEKARAEFYKKLPERLATARALARGTREASKDEVSHPPPTEHELREERLKNERRWRADAIGWDVVRPDAEPVWDERFRDVLRVFVDPGEGVDE